MNYKVRIISNEELPAWVPWLFVRRNGQLEFWLRESTAQYPEHLAMALGAAWETFRRIEGDELLSWPMLASA